MAQMTATKAADATYTPVICDRLKITAQSDENNDHTLASLSTSPQALQILGHVDKPMSSKHLADHKPEDPRVDLVTAMMRLIRTMSLTRTVNPAPTMAPARTTAPVLKLVIRSSHTTKSITKAATNRQTTPALVTTTTAIGAGDPQVPHMQSRVMGASSNMSTPFGGMVLGQRMPGFDRGTSGKRPKV